MNTLKFFSITLLFLCCFSFVQSCDKDAAVEERLEIQKNQMESYAEMAATYNVEKGPGLNSINQAFTGEGRITSELKTEIVEKETIEYVEIVFETASGKSQDEKLYFEVGYPSNILEGMTNVSVAFFNDVLIFVDLESGREVTFEVPNEDEVVSKLQLGKGKTEVNHIGIYLEDKEVLRRRGCYCSCVLKTTPITQACSCKSACGSACSVSCSIIADAKCVDFCAQQ